MKRIDERRPDELRPITIKRHYIKHAEGSVFISTGDTQIICTATVENHQPNFMREQGIRRKGWVTAEYAMLPRATKSRMRRDAAVGYISGRTQEIQRLIGRSLRAAMNLKALGEHTIRVDCDVIQADGGTRAAAITGAFIALWDAGQFLVRKRRIEEFPILQNVAATSVGIIKGQPFLDLCYSEDSAADVDMNVVMTGTGKFIEVQGTAEAEPFSREESEQLLNLASEGIQRIIRLQNRIMLEDLDTVVWQEK